MKKEGCESVTNCNQLKLEAADGKKYLTDATTAETLLRQLGMYMQAVDNLLRHPDDKATIGLLLVREKNRILVEYALGDTKRPITVAEWETHLTQSLPDSLKGSLPSIEEIEAELSATSS